MKRRVYIETSVISYLTSRVSRDLIVAGHQQITQEWWTGHSGKFEIFVSQAVVEEASAGDRVDYLLTWNCKHLANAALRGRIDRVCRSGGYEPVVICTPEELLED